MITKLLLGDQEPSNIYHPYLFLLYIYIFPREITGNQSEETTILVRVARNNRIYLPEFTNDKRSNFAQGNMRNSHIRIRIEWNRVIQPRSPSSVGTSFFPPAPHGPAIRILEPSNSARADELRARGVSRSRGLHETSPPLASLLRPTPPFDNVTSRKVSWLVVTCRGREVDNDPRYRGNYDPPEIRSASERWVCRDGCNFRDICLRTFPAK